MKKSYWLLLLIAVSLTACKSYFETVRTSNDPQLILAEALKYYEAKDYYKAQSLLELSIPNYRGKKEAEDLFYKYAYTHYYLREYILASHYFKNFASTFYNSQYREEAEYMSAYSNYQMSPSYKLDQSYTDKAIEGFQQFVNTYPRSDRVEECNRLIDEMRQKLEVKAFHQGKLYYNIGQYQSALKAFEIMLKDFPESDKAQEVRFLMLKSSFILAENSVYERREERYGQTIDLYNQFIKKHPGSKFRKEAKQIKQDSEKELAKFKV